jgi:hypothetical protein
MWIKWNSKGLSYYVKFTVLDEIYVLKSENKN